MHGVVTRHDTDRMHGVVTKYWGFHKNGPFNTGRLLPLLYCKYKDEDEIEKTYNLNKLTVVLSIHLSYFRNWETFFF